MRRRERARRRKEVREFSDSCFIPAPADTTRDGENPSRHYLRSVTEYYHVMYAIVCRVWKSRLPLVIAYEEHMRCIVALATTN